MTHLRAMGIAATPPPAETEVARLRAELERERERRAAVEVERDEYLEQLLRTRRVAIALAAG